MIICLGISCQQTLKEMFRDLLYNSDKFLLLFICTVSLSSGHEHMLGTQICTPSGASLSILKNEESGPCCLNVCFAHSLWLMSLIDTLGLYNACVGEKKSEEWQFYRYFYLNF